MIFSAVSDEILANYMQLIQLVERYFKLEDHPFFAGILVVGILAYLTLCLGFCVYIAIETAYRDWQIRQAHK